MADDLVSSVTHSTLDSAVSLQSVVQAVPDLENSNLYLQLQATISLCRFLQQYTQILRSESSKQVIEVLKHIGKFSQEVKQDIEVAYSAGPVDWAALSIRGRTISSNAAFLQMQTSTVCIGAISQALSQGWIRLSPEAKAEYQDIIEDTQNAAASNLEFTSQRLLHFMQGLTNSPTSEGGGTSQVEGSS